MSSETPLEQPPKRTAIDRFLAFVEKAGNALPHPASLFAILALAVIVLSGITSYFGISAEHPAQFQTDEDGSYLFVEGTEKPLLDPETNEPVRDEKTGEVVMTGEKIPVRIEPVNLFSIEGLHRILTSMVTNFTGFAPLGTVLVALLGIGIAEGSSGLIGAALRLAGPFAAPKRLLTFVIVFSGVLSNTASEVGYVLLVPLGGHHLPRRRTPSGRRPGR